MHTNFILSFLETQNYWQTTFGFIVQTGCELCESSTNILSCIWAFCWQYFSSIMEKVWSAPSPSPLSPSSREKGQVDDAICGLEAGHKTASLCAQKPSIITDRHTNANDQRVPERCACCAICTAGPCGPRGYQLSTKSSLQFLFIYSGELRGHTDRTREENLWSLLHLCLVFGPWIHIMSFLTTFCWFPITFTHSSSLFVFIYYLVCRSIKRRYLWFWVNLYFMFISNHFYARRTFRRSSNLSAPSTQNVLPHSSCLFGSTLSA